MPALKNRKHEQFAQLVACGMSHAEAIRKLGTNAKDPGDNATKLLRRHPGIGARIEELRAEFEAKLEAKRLQRVDNTVGTKLWIEGVLIEVIQRAMQYRPVLDGAGNQVFIETPSGQIAAAFTFDAKVATNAAVWLGKERGMFAPRFQLPPSIFDGLPPEAVMQIKEGLEALRAGRLIEQEDEVPDLSQSGYGKQVH